MIIVISPAKALDFSPVSPVGKVTQPDFLETSEKLIGLLRLKTPAEIAQLMSISDRLATLNVARYAAWSRPFSIDNAKQSVFAFNGDAYEGLDASSLDTNALDWLQSHLRILSGLYGLLRPLDLMQAYRLEMGTKLANPAGKDLYAFWGERITQALNTLLEKEKKGREEAVLVNLASNEYFKSIKPELLKARVVTPVFEDWKNGRYKIISFYAKRARGLMSRYAAMRRLEQAEDLKKFDMEGYIFDPEASTDASWVFRRREG